jgi:hypothetical protein
MSTALEDIKRVLDSDAGSSLKAYLTGKLNELNSLTAIKEKDVAAHQALEVKAQKRAYEKLKEILSFIMSLEGEKKEKDPRDSFHI